MWEERGGGKSLYLPAIYPCASQHQQPAVSTQSGPGWNEATHGILQVKGFFIRFKIESLLACFRGQNADNNRPQKLCFIAMQYGHYDLFWSPVHDSSSAPPYPPYVIHGLSLYHNITWSKYSEHDKL